MTEREQKPSPTLRDLDAMIELIKIFEDPNRPKGGWGDATPGVMPIYHHGPAEGEFTARAYRHNFVYSFDWPSWAKEADRRYADPTSLNDVDLLTLRKLVTMFVRQERFCEGSLSALSESGYLLAILHRLREIRAQMSES